MEKNNDFSDLDVEENKHIIELIGKKIIKDGTKLNNELEYLGSTILHLDAGIDTGDIICHVRPKIELNDNVHTLGCKIIKSSVESLIKIIKLLDEGKKLNRVKQWDVKDRYYKTKDFDEIALSKYKNNLKNDMMKNYLESKDKKIILVDL